MSIEFSCGCGKSFKVRDELAGKKGKCPGCGGVVLIPKLPEPQSVPEADGAPDIYSVDDPEVHEPVWTVQRGEGSEDPDFAAGPAASGRAATIAPDAPRVKRGGVREWLYLLVGLALVPLLLSTLQGSHESPIDRIKASIRAHPEVAPEIEELAQEKRLTKSRLLAALPGHRVEGAFLGSDSEEHWLFALLAAGAFFAVGVLLLPASPTRPLHAFYTGLFTGTAGIILLLLVQLIAGFMRGRIIIPRSVVGLFFLLLKAIQVSYDYANDPESGFIPSAIGFTFGVGLCEELCKALPVLWHYRTKGTLDWRGACVWGFLSGAGFGVAEAIMYSGDFYNGMATGDTYVIRFVSCIGLHGIWAAAAGIFISKHRTLIQTGEDWYNVFFGAAALVAVPMVLHGLYDTMLKKEMDGAALVVAIVSFGWLIYQVEQARRSEGPGMALATAG